MSNVNQHNLVELKMQIAASRQKLQALWDARGYTDAEVLAAGLELDQFFNEYHKLQAENAPDTYQKQALLRTI